jgi:hypothetical protein
MAGYGSFSRVLDNDAGTALDGSVTLTADDYTETFKVTGYNWFGLFADVGTVSGTTPTLNPKLEISCDGGTTWVAFPGAENSTTQAALTEMDTTGDTRFEYWRCANGYNDVRYRVFLDVGGTTPSFGSLELRLIGWDKSNGSV